MKSGGTNRPRASEATHISHAHCSNSAVRRPKDIIHIPLMNITCTVPFSAFPKRYADQQIPACAEQRPQSCPVELPRGIIPQIHPADLSHRFIKQTYPADSSRRLITQTYPADLSRRFITQIHPADLSRRLIPQIYPAYLFRRLIPQKCSISHA